MYAAIDEHDYDDDVISYTAEIRSHHYRSIKQKRTVADLSSEVSIEVLETNLMD